MCAVCGGGDGDGDGDAWLCLRVQISLAVIPTIVNRLKCYVGNICTHALAQARHGGNKGDHQWHSSFPPARPGFTAPHWAKGCQAPRTRGLGRTWSTLLQVGGPCSGDGTGAEGLECFAHGEWVDVWTSPSPVQWSGGAGGGGGGLAGLGRANLAKQRRAGPLANVQGAEPRILRQDPSFFFCCFFCTECSWLLFCSSYPSRHGEQQEMPAYIVSSPSKLKRICICPMPSPLCLTFICRIHLLGVLRWFSQ